MSRLIPVLPRPGRRAFLALPASAALPVLCGCGPQHSLPEPTSAQLNAAQRTIEAAGSLQRTQRSQAQQVEMLRRVATRVIGAADPFCRDYLDGPCRFNVGLDTAPEANAYAAEGNVVAVTSGMMEIVQNDAELAAVVAHEVGHHLANHLQRAGTRTQLGGLVGALVGGYFGGDALAQTGARLGAGAARIAYSQAEESEADYLAAFIVSRAGYDLNQAGQIWVRLSQAAGGTEQPSILRTHPTGPQRLAAWQRTVAEIQAAGGNAQPRRV